METTSIIKKNGRKVRLPPDFAPGKFAVLCGRGSKCTKSTGNRRLRQLVHNYMKPYSDAKNKVEKTSIVSAIIDAVKQESPDGSFVKFEEGAWWEVEDAFAREKIGCMFRDCLHTQYRSSTKAKLARKKSVDNSSVMDDGFEPILTRVQPSNMLSSKATFDSNSDADQLTPLSGVDSSDGRLFHQGSNFNFGLDHGFEQNMNVTHMNSQQSCFDNRVKRQTLPQNHQPIEHQSMGGLGIVPTTTDVYKKTFGDYFNGSNGRSIRPDFMRDCMPAANNLALSSDMLKQQQMMMMMMMMMQNNSTSSISDLPQRQSQTNSLIRAACDIVEGGSRESNILNDDDFPDDLSDIFENDDNEDPVQKRTGKFLGEETFFSV